MNDDKKQGVHATCTWGDGPDVILSMENHIFILHENPTIKGFKHGTVKRGSTDLTADEAIKLGNELINAAAQAKDLVRIAKDHDDYADLFEKSLNGCKKEGKCCGKHKLIVHEEPGEDDQHVRVERTRDEAIAYQKSAAFKSKGYVYATNQMALDDYMTIHGAWEEN